MVTGNDTRTRQEKQEKNSRRKQRAQIQNAEMTESRRIPITADTPHGLCGERLSAFGGLMILVKFLSLIEFKDAFDFSYARPVRKAALGCYKMTLGIIIMIFVGFQRIGHIASLRYDPMITGILNVSRLPVVSTFWRYLVSLGHDQEESLLMLMGLIRGRVWHLAGYHPDRIRINIDTTVSTVYGETEQACKGHNTKHRGKKGLRPVLCFIDQTREYLCGAQREGKTMGGDEVAEHILKFRSLIPAGIRDILVCGDGEFISWQSVEACQKEGFSYIFGNKRCAPLFPDNEWYRHGEHEYNECYYQPMGWKQSCRFVVMRILNKAEEGQSLFPETEYTYRAFVTNRTRKPHNVIVEYDKRADVENSIKEAQEEGIMAIPSKKFLANCAFFQIAMLSYDIWRWIKFIDARSQGRKTTLRNTEAEHAPVQRETIRTTRLKKLYVPAKLVFHANRGKALYSVHDARSAELTRLLDYFDKRRSQIIRWPDMAPLRKTG